jgi:hypothetical protein
MRDLAKTLYCWKIKMMFYYGLGYNEVSSLISMVKDVAILLGFVVVVFKINLSILVTVIIFSTMFLTFILLGYILKKTGMSDYATRMNNSVNPELKLVRKIAEKLDIKDFE